MTIGAARTATQISVSIAPDPALVRMVRLVAASVARRVSDDEEFVEEIRLAVGEACALLIGPEADRGDRTGAERSDSPGTDEARASIEVAIRLEERLVVTVSGPGAVSEQQPPVGDLDGVEPWALLRGLVDDFSLDNDAETSTLTMTWPLTTT